MQKIRLIIQYDGTNYHGWQIQPDRLTIQGTIETLLYKITSEKISLAAAGRTDAGVHALAQVATFFTTSRLSPEIFLKALNSLLPGDIKIAHADNVTYDFHPRYSARKKRYFYHISNETFINPFLNRYVWNAKYPLNASHISTAKSYLIGRHDFRSFSSTHTDVKTTIRKIFELNIENLNSLSFMGVIIKGKFIKISIEADGFLRHMVRNIVGTLIEVGRGRIEPQNIKSILLMKDRNLAGPTAPAKGLFLEEVIY